MAHSVNESCVACGACVDTCPVGAITLEDKAVVNADTCIDCGACEGVCPTGAISGVVKQPHSIDVNACIKCGACIEKCRFDAIKKQ